MTSITKLIAVTVGTLVVLTVVHVKPWIPGDANAGKLNVGFLPVTCHLTCPVTDYATKSTTTGTHFTSQRFTEFPTVVEALISRRRSCSLRSPWSCASKACRSTSSISVIATARR